MVDDQIHSLPWRCRLHREKRKVTSQWHYELHCCRQCLWQSMIPLFWFVTTDASNQIPQGPICLLSLAICRVCGRTALQWIIEHFPQSHPKVAKELHILIRSNGLRYAMQANNTPKEQSSHMRRIGCLSARDEVSHHGKPVHNHEYRVHSSLGMREA